MKLLFSIHFITKDDNNIEHFDINTYLSMSTTPEMLRYFILNKIKDFDS